MPAQALLDAHVPGRPVSALSRADQRVLTSSVPAPLGCGDRLCGTGERV
ncbi:hypothetical protein HMPREF9057_01209 [Actinomyces sp. oral taxon 171 str. F0337]|nr:hypothetical protein HMPREF9057_01209 [Actinomyces sp. oral taxon 171 str. F0337]